MQSQTLSAEVTGRPVSVHSCFMPRMSWTGGRVGPINLSGHGNYETRQALHV
jgi:hypothetical protein